MGKYFSYFMRRFRDDDVMALSSQLAYSLLLSFFPLLMFVMTIISFSPIKREDVLYSLVRLVPNDSLKLIDSILKEVLSQKSVNLLSLSLIFTIWTASSGFNAVIKAINKAYDVKEERGYFKVQFTAVLCTLALAVIILITFLLLIFGELNAGLIVKKFNLTGDFFYLWNVIRYMIMFAAMIFTFAVLYRYTPCKRLKWREVVYGAIFATAGWIAVSLGFSFYVDNFANYSRFYGSIGAVIVLMVWLSMTSLIIILGGEVNAVMFYDKKIKK